MTGASCPSDTAEVCGKDARRAQIRASSALTGIDFVEVYPDGLTLCVHFFGAEPKQLTRDEVIVTGGVRVRDIEVISTKLHEHADGDVCLLVGLNKTGDFSTYCLCLVEREPPTRVAACDAPGMQPKAPPVLSIDPRYACASFSFHLDCQNTDCKLPACPPAAKPPLPAVDYLARDFTGFRRLMLDRLAQTLPGWNERHLPDLGITLVELFAYVADQLSYELDAVATEAYLRTARRRISVRRHARLVDYCMHEGCNARAWVTIGSDVDLPQLPLEGLAFAALSGEGARGGGLLERRKLQWTTGAIAFEPVRAPGGLDSVEIVAAHSEIQFYTWQRSECCLPAGSTRATLLDGADSADEPYRLRLKQGDRLIFEETRGCVSGSGADADPTHRHVVCVTRANQSVDPLDGTRVWEIEWHRDDALPFDLRLSVRTAAPSCVTVDSAVARGNVLLVDHGLSVKEDDEWLVEIESEELCCVCDGAPPAPGAEGPAPALELTQAPKRLAIELSHAPLTHAEPYANAGSAAAWAGRDPRKAAPAVWLFEEPAAVRGKADVAAERPPPRRWHAARDLLASGPRDRHFVVEIDDEARAHLRFGDGEYGMRPEPGSRFRAGSRVGNGPAGNVGRDALTWIVFDGLPPSGARLSVRNPLPATGGVAAEEVEDVKLFAPHAFGRVLERAVAAADYAELADENPRVQGAFAELAWTGSWYEASVALDTFARDAREEVEAQVQARLAAARRIGHDLRVVPARRVPLEIALSVCVEPHCMRSDIERAARDILSDRRLRNGDLGCFHPDRLVFGADVAGSPIVAAVQALDGVAHVEFVRFARLGADEADAAQTLLDNVIGIHADEIAVLSSDRQHPEQGRLTLHVRGGR